MSNCYLEQRVISKTIDRVADVARHLHVRQTLGPSVIIADQPMVFLSNLRKHWLKNIQALLRQRSSTLDKKLISELNDQVVATKKLQFVAGVPSSQPAVYVVSPEELQELPQNCATLYVQANLNEQQLQKYTKKLPLGAVIVDYKAKN